MEWLAYLIAKIGTWLSENLPAALAAMFGTFFGAWFAFLFQRQHQKQLRLKAALSAGRQAQFALIAQLNSMQNIREHYLKPKEKDESRHLTLTPFQVLVDLPRAPLNDLAFFLEDDGSDVLNKAMLAEHRFFTFVAHLEQRNQRHEKMQRTVAQVGPVAGIDDATAAILKDMTDSLYGLSEDVVKYHEQSINAIRAYLKKRFPNEAVLAFEYPAGNGGDSKTSSGQHVKRT